MLRLSAEVCIYVASQAIDFRKAINGLTALISEEPDHSNIATPTPLIPYGALWSQK